MTIDLTGGKTSLHAELSAAGEGLSGNTDVLRSVLASCGDCIKILDLEGRLQFMSEGGKRVMEVDDFSALKGCPWPDFWKDAGNSDARNAVETARRGGIARFKGAADTAKGNSRYWDVQVSPIVGPDGKPSHILSISRDITAEWRANTELNESIERQKLLAGELQHRIKNTLAVVSAIANQTIRGNDIDEARSAFTARLITLGNAHDILTQTNWGAAPIKEVVEGALAPHRTGQGRIQVDGPELRLDPRQALALALAVHELATNAVKYGALSNAEGKINVQWSTDLNKSEPTFAFRWAESGGPTVSTPDPKRKGFGSRLIERMLAQDFDASVRINYEHSGVVCEVSTPLANLHLAQPRGVVALP